MGRVRAFAITRTGKLEENVRVVEQRAQSFIASAAMKKGASLVVSRTGGHLRSHVVVPDLPGVDKQVLGLAQSVSGRLSAVVPETDRSPDKEYTDGVDLTAAPFVGHLTYRTTDASAHMTQAGADLAETSRQLANVMPDGAWVGLSARTPRKSEQRRWAKWLAYRTGTPRPIHHSMSTHSVIASVWVGAANRDEAEVIVDTLRANLPGFDLDARLASTSRAMARAIPMLAGIAALVATVLGYLPIPTIAGIGAAGVGVLIGAGVHFGYLPTADSRVWRALHAGHLPDVPTLSVPPAAPRKEQVMKDGSVVHAREGAYPLHPGAFKIGPALLAATIAPHAGAASGVQTTATRATPPAVVERIGPMLGAAADGQVAHLSARDIDSSVALSGAPGSGKSSTVRHLTAWYMLERTQPCGLPGFPGANNSLVAFVPKSDDAAKVGAWARALGDKMRLVEVASPDGFAIDLFGVPGTVKDKALHVVSAMRYAFGAESIGVESTRSLTWVLTAAQVVDEVIAATAGVETGRSPMYYAYVLLAGYGDEKAVALAKAFESALSTTENRIAKAERDGADLDADPALDALYARRDNLILARDELLVMFGPKVTPAQRAAFQKAPGNKVYAILNLEHWWSPARRKFSWDQAITGHRAVLVMTGTTAAGHRMEAETEKAMASMLMFSLRDTIERRCAGWAEQNRWTTIIADEVSDLAGTSPEVLTWARDRGRSYGVRLVLATQRSGQLPPEVKTVFMSFSNLVAFKQDTNAVAAEIAADLAADGSEWTAADVLNLPEHAAIVRANVGFVRQAAYTVHPAFFEHEMGAFAAAQGYRTVIAPTTTSTAAGAR